MEELSNDFNDTVIGKLIRVKEELPRKQKMLANYIIENSEQIGIMTAKELADKANVGTTTVMRLTNRLNYNSFNVLKKDLYNASLNYGLTTWWHLKKSFENDQPTNNTVGHVWEEVITLLEKTLSEAFYFNFNKTINLMLESSRINILGLRSSKIAANYLGFLLEEFSPKINQISNDAEFLYDRLLQINKGEILIIFGHSPFAVQSVEAAKYCYENGIQVILITDLMSSPITQYSSILLNVKASSKQYSIVPTITLIEALVIEYGRRTSDHSIEHLDKLGRLLNEKNITTSQNLKFKL
ncbi:DNA-binding transcriptional regulator, MurR/RpiR family, contains HTH and SIS domains [Lentibacillus persicus]|uniref:DNA-binding transcriptional regulator, MurR/RpiR family, contains HTH and SIS domains n=1 Tax=Lentibacillus persicus TaxID=640948 RepID=A0A1I1VXH4_9BACI|nr:MurR/RpiR family transcriptional regulator [Lentibacillus persicus]SFD87796.1 DNA-binding transcriptional regulator, MurR/RpiR family, contains HTH and SIS domains [Lentibacillus persicus]